MISPDFIDPALGVPAAALLGLFALLPVLRKRPYASLDCLDGKHGSCDDCDACACHGDWAPNLENRSQ